MNNDSCIKRADFSPCHLLLYVNVLQYQRYPREKVA